MKKVQQVTRTNKIDNADLFTNAATHHYEKHIKTQSKQTLKFIDAKIRRLQIGGVFNCFSVSIVAMLSLMR